MSPSLYMILVGCRPQGRNIEQHDVFFGIADSIKTLIPDIKSFWKGSGKIHIDGWRKVSCIDGFQISITDKVENHNSVKNLFFINLGGYKPGEFEEFHYKLLSVAATQPEAISKAKNTAFFKHTSVGKKGASHIDDKYGVDVDDIFLLKEILPLHMKNKYSIHISDEAVIDYIEDEIHLGYFKLTDF